MKEKGSNLTLPLLALRGVVVFPNGIINIEVARPKSIAAILHAEEIKTNKKQAMKIFLVTQKTLLISRQSRKIYSKLALCAQ